VIIAIDQRRAATIAAATAPDLISGLIELAPFTAHSRTPRRLLRIKRYRSGTMHLTATLLMEACRAGRSTRPGVPTKPSDWDTESAASTPS